MQKKYIVRLTEEERRELREVIKKLKGSSQKVRRAQILLKADIEGSNWTDEHIAEGLYYSFRGRAFSSCRSHPSSNPFDGIAEAFIRV